MSVLDELLEQARLDRRQAEAKDAAAWAAAKARNDEIIRSRLEVGESDLRMMLGSAVYDELGIELSSLSSTDAKHWDIEAVFTDADSGLRVAVKIEYDDVTNIRKSPMVTYQGFNGWRSVASEQLLPYLLDVLVSIRDKAARQRAEQAREEQEAAAKAEAQRQVAEEAQRVDAEIRAQIAEIKTLGPTWRWKDGAVVTIYVMTYVSGMVEGEDDGGRYATSEAVYTLTDALDAHGYITTYLREARSDIKLSMQAHLPIWERLTLRSVEDVPAQLLQPDYRELIGATAIEWNRNTPSLYAYSDDPARVSVHVGSIPARWLRELVESA